MFFMLAGAYEVLCSIMQWSVVFLNDKGEHYPGHHMVVLFGVFCGVVSLLLGLANLYVGANLARLLVTSPGLPLRFTKFSMILAGCTFNIMGFGANYVILSHLKRLAAEAEPVVETHALS